MSLFTSSREKRLWFWTLAVVVAIFAILFIGRPLANQLRDQNVQAIFFAIAMLLVGAAMLVYGLRTKPGKTEVTILLGIIAVYTLFIFRLGAPERSHLIEYSVLTIFVHQALMERSANGKPVLFPALLAFLLTFLVGVLDELIQLILPNRVFDMEDILFNGLAATMAIGSKVVLTWVRKRMHTKTIE